MVIYSDDEKHDSSHSRICLHLVSWALNDVITGGYPCGFFKLSVPSFPAHLMEMNSFLTSESDRLSTLNVIAKRPGPVLKFQWLVEEPESLAGLGLCR